VTDWDSIYAKTITATGWTWEYIDEFLTLPRLNALFEHWAEYPPVHITAALFAGIKSDGNVKRKRPSKKIQNVWQGANVVSDQAFFALKQGVRVLNKRLPR
jgi:hypothetical protein